MSGYLGDLSPNQEEALRKIREIFSDDLEPQHDDHFLLQFLRAKRFDIQKTQDMLRKHLRFRMEFPESMANEFQPPQHLVDELMPPLLGYDKEGCPVRIVPVGRQDIPGLLNCVRRSELKKYLIWFLDTDKAEMRKRSKETGIHIEKRTFIIDLEGICLRQIYRRDLYEIAINLLKLYEANYPENLKVVFVINIPSFFYYLFNLFKHIITDETMKTIKIYNHNGWKKDVLNCIDANILPVIYGGTRTDPNGDPNCPSLIRVINPIPKEWYLKQNHMDITDEGVHKVILGPRSKLRLPVMLDIVGSTLVWEVECITYDVKASLLYSDESSSVEPVVEPMLVKSEFGSERGCYMVEKTGEYCLLLDNSYSLLRSKTILYKIFVSTLPVQNSNSPESSDLDD